MIIRLLINYNVLIYEAKRELYGYLNPLNPELNPIC
jgi:hypothetical protein